LLYRVQNKIGPERIVPAYLYLGESRIDKESEVLFLENESERIGGIKEISELIGRIIDEIRDSSVPFLPPADFDKACPRCPFTGLCGTQWVKDWRF
jgi:hypothetical protein